jgi:prevent-host-death family protein
MTTVNVHEAKTNLSRLLEDVASGKEVIISRRGVPVARLCALERPARRVPGLLSGSVGDAFFEPLPDGELAGWEG